jgi:hypothetical protein
MRKINTVLFLIACISQTALVASSGETGKYAQIENFLIDESKPYVYLAVDHIGARKPLLQGESNVGLWLRLKNNCRVPIVILTFKGPPTGTNAEAGVVDEVVRNPPAPMGDTAGSGVLYERGQEGLTDIFLSPNMNEAEVRGAEDAIRSAPQGATLRGGLERPHGYNNGHQPGVQGITVVPPGGEVAFSVPINHVGEAWHFEIPFRFALNRQGPIRQPYSYVAFYQGDLPKDQKTVTTSRAGCPR